MSKDKKPTFQDLLKARKDGDPVKKKRITKDPLWDLYRDGVTQTMIGKFLGCRERFHKQTVEGWTAKGLSIPLEYGNIFHDLLEAHYGGATQRKLLNVVKKYIKNKQENSTASNEDIEKLAYSVLVTFNGYVKHWIDNPTYSIDGVEYFDNQFVWLGQEEVFEVKHIVPQRNVTLTLKGRWDGVFRHPESGHIVLMENKTKGRINQDAIQIGLKEDLQCMMYCYTLYRRFGEMPRHILYNVIRRSQMRPRVSETTKDFVQRMGEDIEKRGDYYFLRWDADVTKDMVMNFVTEQLNLVLVQMIDWWESIKHDPLNPRVLENGDRNELHFQRPMGVYDSEMYTERGDIPEIVLEGNYDKYYQREHAFPELVD